MRRLPETFELTEEDIKEAIAHWLSDEHISDGDYHEFNISFKAEEKRSPGRGLPGGMNDDLVTTVITAVAVKQD